MTYSTSLAVGRQRYADRMQGNPGVTARTWGTKNQNTTSFRERGRAVGPVTNTIMLIVLACLVGLLYLTQVTKTNAYSYRINDFKEQQASLEAEHDQLTIDSARLQAQERIKNSTVAKNLVTVAPKATIQN
jgi:hypothetical protein